MTIAMLMLSCKKESIEPTAKSSTELNGAWLVGSSTTMSISDVDTTYVNYEYVGDGICCNPTFVNITGSSYLTNDVITVAGDSYKIIKHKDDSGLDDDYRYFVSLEILSPYNGCVVYYDLFKRSGD